MRFAGFLVGRRPVDRDRWRLGVTVFLQIAFVGRVAAREDQNAGGKEKGE